MRRIGTVILILGLVGAIYGATGFFFVNTLPPNGGTNGRLPSLYILLGAMGVMLLGTTLRGLRQSKPK